MFLTLGSPKHFFGFCKTLIKCGWSFRNLDNSFPESSVGAAGFSAAGGAPAAAFASGTASSVEV